MFGALTKYSFAIYRSIFMGLEFFRRKKHTFKLPASFKTKLLGGFVIFTLKSTKILKVFQSLAEKFVKTTSTIHKQPINKILPAAYGYCVVHFATG